jgi:thioredoxin reductase (NADPH)
MSDTPSGHGPDAPTELPELPELPALPGLAGRPGVTASRRAQVFPALNEEQFARLSLYGEARHFPAGAVLYRQGERHIAMYAVLSGEVQISRSTALGTQVMGTHGAGMFTGEVGTLAGRGAIATVCTTSDCELLVVEEESLRTLVIAEAELSETIMRAYILRRVAFIEDQYGAVILLGSDNSADTLRLREFMGRNGQPAAYFDIERHAGAAALMQRFNVTAADIPVVITAQGEVLKQPGIRQLADATGISADRLNGRHFDVVVVGAGPGGLAAAVYAASEGLSVAVLDAKAPGGQAGSSSKIENYFGFPTGISGVALAGRGLSQARKFGAEVAVPQQVLRLECRADTAAGDGFALALDGDERVTARAVVIATGARYRKPDLARLEHFEGRGVYYNASFMEATFCADEEVVVVGGGNSAGQAAVFLAARTRHVHIMVRAEGLAASMSHYLIQRIEAAANITLHTRTQITQLVGEERLDSLMVRHGDDAPAPLAVRHVFLFLGAEPNTGWLNACVALDDRQFVLTGDHVPSMAWPGEGRAPHFLETSRPGIFAVGDVRSGSVKRVATAVGEGAAAVQYLHQVLAGV